MNPFLRGGSGLPDVLVIAHRGAHLRAPENSMAAFEEAIEAEADAIEFDVRFGRGGAPVVLHDRTLERTTPVAGSYPERAPYDLAAFDDDELRRLGVPLLADVLAWAAERSILLNLELKETDPAGVAGVLGALDGHGLVERTLVSSFDHEALRRLKDERPDVATAALSAYRLARTIEYVTEVVGADAYHPGCVGDYDAVGLGGTLDGELFETARAAGVRIHPWTLVDPAAMARLIEAGADGVITDDPAALRQLVAR